MRKKTPGALGLDQQPFEAFLDVSPADLLEVHPTGVSSRQWGQLTCPLGFLDCGSSFELRLHRMLHRCAVVNQRWTSAPSRWAVPLRRRTSAAQGAPGHDTGMPALVDHHLAIDNDVLDTDRELLGLGTRGRSFDALGIEDDDIGVETITQQATVGKPQALSRERRHLTDGIRQVHKALLPGILGEDDRECAVGTW